MKGLTWLERRALVNDPTAAGEWIPEFVFEQLLRDRRATYDASGDFVPTRVGELALLVCPESRA